MTSPAVKIRFVGATRGDAGQYAQELQEVLRENAPEIKASREPSESDAQGFGDTLMAILPHVPDALHISATLALALIEGIHVWMLHKAAKEPGRNPVVELERNDGTKVQLDAAAVDQVVKALRVVGGGQSQEPKP
ncbi:MAG TPA: hypothetical protein VFW33_15260 [Gemmataceae bacterium]|nr:hypothetical protein [Gemmataceae bacterium]